MSSGSGGVAPKIKAYSVRNGQFVNTSTFTDLLTAEEMRAAEAEAMTRGLATGGELMERAGRGVVEAAFARWPRLAAGPGRALVLCGPGNNGGDGFVIARLLRDRGWEVEVRLLGSAERLPPDARAAHDRWAAAGAVGTLGAGWDSAAPRDLVIDALFGTGLSRPVDLPWLDRLADIAPGARIVAVDLPSGLCSDSGRVIGERAVRADLTVSFHRAKAGHYLAEGPDHCGALSVVDIGLPPSGGALRRIDRPAAPTKAGGHKFDHGHALVLSGGMGRSGAARLTARGALRIGAGLVTLGAPGAAMMECAAQLTAVMLRRVDGPEALAEQLEDRRLTALCLGPGLGVERASALVPAALSAPHAPGVVLDADALTAIAQDQALFAGLNPRCVLTPHMGEFARLFPDIADRLSAPARRGPAMSRADAARAAAARAGCTLLMKGPDTIVATPDGQAVVSAAVYDDAAPWLATAGAGDVLAGFVTGLLARGMAPGEAALTAAGLHAACARAFGPGLIAEDLPEILPRVMAGLSGI